MRKTLTARGLGDRAPKKFENQGGNTYELSLLVGQNTKVELAIKVKSIARVNIL